MIQISRVRFVAVGIAAALAFAVTGAVPAAAASGSSAAPPPVPTKAHQRELIAKLLNSRQLASSSASAAQSTLAPRMPGRSSTKAVTIVCVGRSVVGLSTSATYQYAYAKGTTTCPVVADAPTAAVYAATSLWQIRPDGTAFEVAPGIPDEVPAGQATSWSLELACPIDSAVLVAATYHYARLVSGAWAEGVSNSAGTVCRLRP